MNALKNSAIVLSMLATLAMSAGCQSDNAHPSPSAKVSAMMSPTEAKSKLGGLLDDTFSAVTPVLQFWESWPVDTENDTPKGTANVAVDRYVMTTISPAKRGALLGIVERHWRARGYTIESVNADATMPAIFARTPDGSTLQITVGYPGNVTISADVNSIKAMDPLATVGPFGPPPPHPTTADGSPDVMPKIDDPFWSH